MENQTVATLGCSNAFWTFEGFDSTTNAINDLWLFDLNQKKWSWVLGKDTLNYGNFGIKGIASTTNIISSRGGVSKWTDKVNDLWVFGGYTSAGLGNDLWKYTPDTTCFSTKLISGFSLGMPSKNNICLGDSVVFSIPNNHNLHINPLNGIGINADSTFIIFKPTTTTSYTSSATDDGTTCVGADTIHYTFGVYAKPTASFTLLPNTILLPKNTFTLTNTSTNAQHYEWYYNNTIFSTLTSTTKSFADTGVYCITLIAYNAAGCADTAVHCATIQTNIHLNNPVKNTICLGDSVIYTLPSNIHLHINPMNSVTINADSTLIVFKPTLTTTYTISAAGNSNTMVGTDTIVYTLQVLPKPTAAFSISPNPILLPYTAFMLKNTSSNGLSYEWLYNNAVFSTLANDTKSFTDTGTYCITLVAHNATTCIDTAVHCATILQKPIQASWVNIPNSFSPNADGINDILLPIAPNISNPNFVIYNRYGEQIFESQNLLKGWDGFQKGIVCA